MDDKLKKLDALFEKLIDETKETLRIIRTLNEEPSAAEAFGLGEDD